MVNGFAHAKFILNMTKPTAVIDMSLFREICELPAKQERDFIWASLTGKYQIVVPLMMVEEVLVNIVKPGNIAPQVLEMMASDVLQLQPCWIDDVLEYAFRELVLRQPLDKLIPPPDELQQRLLAAKPDAPELVTWVESRKAARKATPAQWKSEQKRIAPDCGYFVVQSQQEFFEKAVKPEFLHHLGDSQRKQDMLETLLGKTFRSRHPDAKPEIDAAFARYDLNTFASFPFTHKCLIARIAYLSAPIVRIQTPRDVEPQMILRPERRAQDNNWADEQYVLSATLCDRLLTMDKGMRNVANLFLANRLWKGQSIFFPTTDLANQIPAFLV